jgi:methylglyoxal synthase
MTGEGLAETSRVTFGGRKISSLLPRFVESPEGTQAVKVYNRSILSAKGFMVSPFEPRRTLIGLLASHDHAETNDKLARILDRFCCGSGQAKLERFHFLVTQGTFRRVIAGDDPHATSSGIHPVKPEARDFLYPRITILPSRVDGGVTILSYFIAQQKCSIVWPFLTPLTGHWLTPENLALMRLSDQWHAKRLMNTGSVDEWFEKEADIDADRNLQACPPRLFQNDEIAPIEQIPCFPSEIRRPKNLPVPDRLEEMTVALIAHDEMKARMVEFATDHERTLARFQRILATSTTGRDVSDAASSLSSKITRYHSGPKGGDIEIATEVLFGRCHVVIFFVDPLRPHPHIEDIRVVFGACMIHDHVRMLTNEMQAREWIERVARRNNASVSEFAGQ